VPAHPIALRAESSNGRDPLAAGAEEWLLAGTGLYPGPQEAFSKAGEGCGCGAQEAIIRRKSLTRRSIIISKNRRILRRRAGT
jgi:hypothetical protein